MKNVFQPMAYDFTPLNLISFMYRETLPEETVALRRELAVNALLNEQFIELNNTRRSLPKATFAPSDAAVNRILAYSARIAAEA
jgi:hypothetical protein